MLPEVCAEAVSSTAARLSLEAGFDPRILSPVGEDTTEADIVSPFIILKTEERFVNPEAKVVWAGLEFRKPAMLGIVAALSDEQWLWLPPNGRNSIAWQLWHIAEVEDNWVRDVLLGQARRYPFGHSVQEANRASYPAKTALLSYFHDVRDITRTRLEAATAADFDQVVQDAHYGPQSWRDIWSGVVTSFAWHAGQIALTNRLVRG
jgi:uncharacterized damage-inducible protein DinB